MPRFPICGRITRRRRGVRLPRDDPIFSLGGCGMSVPLLTGAVEVLKALTLGLELREIAGQWTFVGPWQDPERSKVSLDTMIALTNGGFVRLNDEHRATISRRGSAAFEKQLNSAIRLLTCHAIANLDVPSSER